MDSTDELLSNNGDADNLRIFSLRSNQTSIQYIIHNVCINNIQFVDISRLPNKVHHMFVKNCILKKQTKKKKHPIIVWSKIIDCIYHRRTPTRIFTNSELFSASFLFSLHVIKKTSLFFTKFLTV